LRQAGLDVESLHVEQTLDAQPAVGATRRPGNLVDHLRARFGTRADRDINDFLAVRAAELRHWVENGEYQSILAGNYPRREDDDGASMSEEARQAAESYKESFARSQDPLAKLITDFGGQMDGVRERVSSWFGRGNSSSN
jgi:hypothetical protein